MSLDPVEVILDASQIELFESCPYAWYLSYQLNLTPNRSHRSFDTGSYYHSVLDWFYSLYLPPTQDKPQIKDFVERVRSAMDFAARSDVLAKYNISNLDDIKFHKKRIIDYFYKYQTEDEAMEVIAVEQGFSRLLFEDGTRRYILEGKIDLVNSVKPYGFNVMDHKTQSRKDDRWEFNHQVCNYLSFTGADYFVYNYIGLQDKLPPDGLRRMIYKPPRGMLAQWESEVKRTFDQMYDYLRFQNLNKLDTDNEGLGDSTFPRRRANCDKSKYGLCQFHKICSVPDNTKWVPAVFSAYKTKDTKWRAWT